MPWAQDILDAIDRGDVRLGDYRLRAVAAHAHRCPAGAAQPHRSAGSEEFPNHLYDTNYGLSESSGPGCVHLGIENIHKVGAIGKPGYQWETKIVDESGRAVTRRAKWAS